MGILNGKSVFGLFGRDDEVEEVVTSLQEQGFGKEDENEIRIIDEHRLTHETPFDEAVQSPIPQLSRTASGQPLVPNPVQSAGTESTEVEHRAREALQHLGLDEEEATFHARHIARGSSMVIVETDEEQAPEAEEIMKQANARVSVA